MKRLIIVCLLFFGVAYLGAEKITLAVHIVQSQANRSSGTYTVPGYASTNCGLTTTANTASASCFSSGMASQSFSYELSGATLSLLLPDQRIVVVTCDAKLNWTEISGGYWRSCRVPSVPDLTAEFNGDKAKLIWNVSIDGSKQQNETYKIVAVLAKMK